MGLHLFHARLRHRGAARLWRENCRCGGTICPGCALLPAREGILKKIREYREHAAECRELARLASAGHRLQLEQMAATWDQLAEARQRQLAKAGKSEDDDEPAIGEGRRLDPAHQQQDDQDKQNQSDAAGRVIAPA
jgi:hypothetical protein